MLLQKRGAKNEKNSQRWASGLIVLDGTPKGIATDEGTGGSGFSGTGRGVAIIAAAASSFKGIGGGYV